MGQARVVVNNQTTRFCAVRSIGPRIPVFKPFFNESPPRWRFGAALEPRVLGRASLAIGKFFEGSFMSSEASDHSRSICPRS